MNYGDTHRRFLKLLMDSQIVAQNKAMDLYCDCRTPDTPGSDASQDLGNDPDKAIAKFIEQINNKIEPLNLSIKLVNCEATNKRFYVIYTLNENEITKAVAARQTKGNERALLKVVIKAIVKSPSGKVSIATCARECAELPEKLKRNDVAKILKKLVLEKWLTDVGDQIYIGPKAVAELGKYLKEEYQEEVANCKLCKEITIRGPSCPSNCGVRAHQTCLKSYFSKVKNRICMGCKQAWPESEPASNRQNFADDSGEEDSDDEAMVEDD